MNGEYVLNATAHWRPLVNGYSGDIPDSYRNAADRLWYFPEARAMDALRDVGATHVMVHLEKFTPQERDDIDIALPRGPRCSSCWPRTRWGTGCTSSMRGMRPGEVRRAEEATLRVCRVVGVAQW